MLKRCNWIKCISSGWMGSCTHLTFTTRNLVIVSMVNPSYYQIRFDALFFNEVISCVTFPRLDLIIQFNAVICWFWYVNTAMKKEHGQWTMHIFVSSTVAVIEKEGITFYVKDVHTPNCNKVVIEKWKKRKSQIGINSANLATFLWWILFQPLHFPAGIFSFIVFQL